MKKLLFIIELIVLLQFQLFSQTSFEKVLHSNNNDHSFRAIEDINGNIYVTSRSNSNGSAHNTLLWKLDKYGYLMKDTIISSQDSNRNCIIANLIIYNNSLICLGCKFNKTFPYNMILWYLKLDLSLNFINERELFISDTLILNYFNSIIDNNKNIVLAGYQINPNNSNISPFLFKIGINGDSINSNLNITPFGEFYSLLQNPNSNGYYVFANHIFTYSNSRIVKVNNDLDTVSSFEIGSSDMRNYYHSKWINDTSFILNSVLLYPGYPIPNNNRDMIVSVIDTNFNILYQQAFGRDTIYDYPGIWNGVSVNGDNVYIGGTTNISILNTYHGVGQPSWFYLIKMDKNQNVLWEKRYGGDTYYLLNSIYATSDGGCIMAGIRENSDVTGQISDLYLLKVDSAGFYCWEREIHIPKEMVKIFPNPFNDNINIELHKNYKNSDVYVYDILGKQVLKSTISDARTSLNTSELSKGIYILKVVAKGESIFVGKAIKE
ncbi:MAG: T9SS type A sorting domain-containing protein [Saprospiraceae bacterium]|nr:T9SS type A sorting domain-containing protein [Saprospiraceae bacterium]